MTPDLELQRRLVAKLSEQIYLENDGKFYWHNIPKVSNRFGDQPVRRTEWLHLVGLIEQTGMDVNQLSAYADALDKVCVPTHICPLTHWQAVTCASWQQRATALAEIGVI